LKLQFRKGDVGLNGWEMMTKENRLDRVGVAASLVCAVHCMAMPLLAGLLPLMGLSFLAEDQTEWVLTGMSLGIGSLSLLPSYVRRHKQWRPILFFGCGASLILAVRLSAEEGSRLEALMMVIGAVLIVCAHVVNRQLCRSCASCHPVSE
jgi:hypothetical protein